MSISWINHKGKRILYSNYSGKKPEDMLKQISEETKMILDSPGNILYLGNFEGTVFSNDFVNKAQLAGKQTRSLVNKSAFVGITGLKAMLQNIFSKFTGINAKAFKDIEEAKEYLAN